MAIFVGNNSGNHFNGTVDPDLFIGNRGSDTFNGESVYPDSSSDIAFGGRGGDWLHMGNGSDLAFGGRGDDYLSGGVTGGDRLFGNRGNDTILGSSDDDFISGGRGRDRIDGNNGDDVLSGGLDSDVFVFEGDIRIAFAGVGDDVITDFQSGVDRIEIAAFWTPDLNTFAEVRANLSNGPDGAVLTVPEGDHIEGTITFLGVRAGELERSDFDFV